jgi:hypothetical protein
MAKDPKDKPHFNWKPVKRDSGVHVRFTKAEYLAVGERAKSAGFIRAAYIRTIALEGQVKARLNEEERHFFRELVSMSNDLHQLTIKAREEKMENVAMYFENYRHKIDDLFKMLRYDE